MAALGQRQTGRDVSADWPDLTLSAWEDTCYALHRWTQVVGKVRLSLEPMLNHWWQVPLYVSARGLTTSLMHAGRNDLEIEFDLIDHFVVIRRADGEVRKVALEPRSVASFYSETMGALDGLGVRVSFLPRPVEVAVSIPFAEDFAQRAYDAAAAERFWRALVHSQRVMTQFRAGFIGNASPVHFFWGGFDLAVSRFSGRKAPEYNGAGAPNCPNWVMRLAYSHEESSCGYWPGGSEEGSFYSYAYPEPTGFADWTIEPAEAYYDKEYGEFLLPYAAVRMAEDPDATLLSFLQSTYDAAAELGRWDRKALETGVER